MKIISEVNLRNFHFWCGGKDTAQVLTYEQLDQIEDILEDIFPDGIDATQLNDIFWFDDDWIAEMLGYENWEDFDNHYVPF